MMSARARAGLVAFALLGLAAAASAMYVHYQLLRQPGYASFCDFSQTMSCSQVYLSRFGSIAGVPVAIPGTIWFVLVLLLAGAARSGPPAFRENVPSYVFVLATLALAVILYLGYASFFILRTVCVLCLATYAGVIGVFLISGAVTTVPMTTLPRRLLTDLRALAASPTAIVVALLFLAGTGSALAFFPREATFAFPPVPAATGASPTPQTPASQAPQQAADPGSEFERWAASQPRVNLPVPNEGAKVLIVKFSDYQCPACAQTYEWYRSILAKYNASYPGQVRFVTLDFPLNPACNAALTRVVHLAACEAAAAVRLARERGRGDAMEQWAYANQTATPEMVRAAARDVGGVTDFDARYAGVIQSVKTDAALGSLNNVRSTPTFFINGLMIAGGMPPQIFDAAIASELKRASK
jgi:uncharacterized membrane protein/protein-disulfide isomerase